MATSVSKILVPTSGDSSGEEAFRLACTLSKDTKAMLYTLYVIEVSHELPLDSEVDPARGESVLSRTEDVAKEMKCHVEAGLIQARRAGPAIVQEAQERGAELIVMGIPYKRRYGQFTLGETATYVLKNAPCLVITWREQAKAGPVPGS